MTNRLLWPFLLTTHYHLLSIKLHITMIVNLAETWPWLPQRGLRKYGSLIDVDGKNHQGHVKSNCFDFGE